MSDLMKPRVVLQIPFPNMNKDHNVGDVFELELVDSEDLSGNEIKAAVYFKEGSGHGYLKSEVDSCTQVFKPLAWYEKRDIKDMPQYVKKSFSKEVIKIDEISNLELMISKGFVMDENTADITAFGSAFFNHYIPATEQEYTDFVNSKNQQS